MPKTFLFTDFKSITRPRLSNDVVNDRIEKYSTDLFKTIQKETERALINYRNNLPYEVKSLDDIYGEYGNVSFRDILINSTRSVFDIK